MTVLIFDILLSISILVFSVLQAGSMLHVRGGKEHAHGPAETGKQHPSKLCLHSCLSAKCCKCTVKCWFNEAVPPKSCLFIHNPYRLLHFNKQCSSPLLPDLLPHVDNSSRRLITTSSRSCTEAAMLCFSRHWIQTGTPKSSAKYMLTHRFRWLALKPS